jgi:Flp pilus assembly pilin Flp
MEETDVEILAQIAKEYGLFVALVVWVLWTSNQREKAIMQENKQRESQYIEREEKYIGIVQTLSEEVKERLTKIETTLKRR